MLLGDGGVVVDWTIVQNSGMAGPSTPTGKTRMQRAKGYDPEPLDVPPLFQSPPRPVAMLPWLVTRFMWPQSILWVGVAWLVWRFATPGLDRFASLSIDDIAILWGRNALLMLLVIGGQHWWLYIRRAQATEFKYESRWLAKGRKSFLFNDQTRDNMFWSLVSGGLIAATFEAVLFRLYATESIPELGPWWAIAVMTFAVFWLDSAHFYAVHRLLHIDPLYKWFHALHHRNVNTGPWTGISMQPGRTPALPLDPVRVPRPARGTPFLVTFSARVSDDLAPSPSHSGFDRFKMFGTDVARRRLLPQPPSPLLRGELRDVARADGQVVRHLPRRVDGGPRGA